MTFAALRRRHATSALLTIFCSLMIATANAQLTPQIKDSPHFGVIAVFENDMQTWAVISLDRATPSEAEADALNKCNAEYARMTQYSEWIAPCHTRVRFSTTPMTPDFYQRPRYQEARCGAIGSFDGHVSVATGNTQSEAEELARGAQGNILVSGCNTS